MRTSRLEAFSDGVLAIIITIMVLELKIPESHDLSGLLHDTGDGLLTYLLSFVWIGIYWVNHHHMFHLVRHVAGGVLWANLALLFTLSLLPFTTAWMDESAFARTPVVVYGLNLTAAALAYLVLQKLIIRHQGAESPLRQAVGSDLKGKISPFFYLAGVLTALLVEHAAIGVAFFAACALLWLIPDRRIDRMVHELEPVD
ncbi:TMEM175 family protein [Actinoplanes sp. TRM 88003]|uniref:TMEM175 family protein n=1 Tax=Paractinoplanes aksuensis TaxID=2939490 RepID=A0ABT1DGL1_9ACTN|nr:TMEM175 family protein [Actinoplanes aksuensis]MCO8269940.1 TMEM175 family protein [Actinoplanes aksuensis]